MALNTCSFNCRGLKGSVTDLSVLAKSFEIICLQEAWLLSNDLGILNDIVPEMTGFGISGMDDKQDLHRGRPRGELQSCGINHLPIVLAGCVADITGSLHCNWLIVLALF